MKSNYPQCISYQLLVLLLLLFLKWTPPYKWRCGCSNVPFALVVPIFFSIVDCSFSFVSYSRVDVLAGEPLGFPEGPVFIGLYNSSYPPNKVQSASAFNTGSPLHSLLLLESPSASCYQRKTGKIACLYCLLFFSSNPWVLCLALPHRMLTILSNS